VGFVLILAVLMLMAWSGYRVTKEADADFNKYESISTNALRLTSIEASFVEVRRQVRLYADEGETKALDRIRAMRGKIETALGAAIPATLNPERKANLEKVKVGFEAYLSRLDELVVLRAKREKSVAEGMNLIGLKAREDISEIVRTAMADGDFEVAALAGVVQEKLLLARLDAVKYVASADPRVLEGAKTRIAAYVDVIGKLHERLQNPTRRHLAEEGKDLAARYLAAVNDAAESIRGTHEHVNEKMAKIAEELAALLEHTVASQKIALESESREINEAFEDSTATAVRLAVGALIVGLLLAWAVSKSITTPVKEMTAAMTTLARGNLQVEVPALENRDEIGEMAHAVQVFKENAIEVERLKAEQIALERRAAEEKKRSMNQLADGFESSVKHVVSAVSSAARQLQQTAQSMSANADQTNRQCTVVAAAAEQASANVQTVASATEELTSSINEISRQVSESTNIGSSAVEEANRANATVNGLSEAAQKIGEVVSLINNIASQTNLLALNATIEAARAGEAGKGFAVVASEVKNLANQTAKATEEIQAQVGQMQSVTSTTVDAIKSITGTIRRMSEISTTIASAVEEQGAATREIARNVSEASKGTQEVSSNISGVAHAAGETGRGASETLSAANNLGTQSENLSQAVEGFIMKVRHA
jgi:methyl-accepting chemotaxis protein